MNNQNDKHPVKENFPMNELNDILCEVQKNLQLLVEKEKNYVTQFKMHHKLIFAFLIFFAVNLIWYGMWEIVSTLPVLKNPIIALIMGAIILIASGYFYENLISGEFNKKSRRKNSE